MVNISFLLYLITFSVLVTGQAMCFKSFLIKKCESRCSGIVTVGMPMTDAQVLHSWQQNYRKA